MTSISLLILLLALIAVASSIVLNIIICVFVYNDAKKRNMNGVLWVLIILLVPLFIGLVLYLILRKDYNIKCSACGELLKDIYTVCPACGAQLKPICSECSLPLQANWSVCPNCSASVDKTQGITPPIKEKRSNKAAWALLILVILVPVLVISSIVVFSVMTHNEDDMYSLGVNVIRSETAEGMVTNEAYAWLEEISAKAHTENTASILQYTRYTENEDTTKYYCEFVIYIPNMRDNNVVISDGNNRTEYYDYTISGDIIIMDFTGNYMPELEITVSDTEFGVVSSTSSSQVISDIVTRTEN